MKRYALALAVVMSLGAASAADPAEVARSAAPFEGAIDAISDSTVIAHLPGYGLHVSAWWIGDFELAEVTEQLTSVVSGLSGLVRGLDAGDFVSVAWNGRRFIDPNSTFVVARMIPGDSGTLEVFLDGVLQE